MASALTTTTPLPSPIHRHDLHGPPIASGEKAKARDILAAIRTLKRIEQEQRPATPEERQALARFAGFGPSPSRFSPIRSPAATRTTGWQTLGEELERCSRPRNTTAPSAPPSTPSTPRRPSSRPCTRPSPAWACPSDATVLEPGCGTGNFMSHGPPRHALHRRRAGPHLRPHRPGAPSRARHPHRELPRHAGCPRTASTP